MILPTQQMDRSSAPSSSLPQNDAFDATATTLMLKSLPRNLTLEMLLENLLVFMQPNEFDFVYLPADHKKPESNICLAFVNFTHPRCALKCFKALKALPATGTHQFGYRFFCRARQAHMQGLALNLAYYFASKGSETITGAEAPAVFAHGLRVDEGYAFRKHVTLEVFEVALELSRCPRNSPIQKKYLTKALADQIIFSRKTTSESMHGESMPSSTPRCGSWADTIPEFSMAPPPTMATFSQPFYQPFQTQPNSLLSARGLFLLSNQIIEF